jgi:hypothetical protein
MRVTVLALLILALAAPAAQAQGSPFQPLPPAAPTPTPPPEPVDGADDGDISRGTLFLIGGGVVAAFVGIGWWITRDARRSLPRDEREPHAAPTTAKQRGQTRERVERQRKEARRRAKAARRRNR